MIQELLGGSALIAGERKISIINGAAVTGGLSTTTTTHSSSSSSSPSSATTATATNNDNLQNLRCPRCDSSNTKFCYYNNYNLTQPRHFCKTCRRYWTKGGALRNVPIGGGCRKNRNVGSMATAVAKTTGMAKMKTVAASELMGVAAAAGFMDHVADLAPPTPILWGSPQNSHILALLRATQTQNPNPNLSPPPMSVLSAVKEEGKVVGPPSEPMVGLMNNNNANNGGGLGFDCVGQFPTTLGLCSSIWRNDNGNNSDHSNINEDGGGFLLGQHHNTSTGIQELYQRLRSSSVNYCSVDTNSPQMFMVNNIIPSSSSLDHSSAPIVTGDDQFMGYTWNPTISSTWSDHGTAYP